MRAPLPSLCRRWRSSTPTCGLRAASETVGGTSIMGLMMLAAGPGTTITVEATGREANEVIEALAALVSGRFTEHE